MVQSCHHQVQQELQAKQAEYMTLQRQLEGQACLMTAIEEEVKVARQELAGIQSAVASNQAHGKVRIDENHCSLGLHMHSYDIRLLQTSVQSKLSSVCV